MEDSELLARFLDSHSESAFAALVERHLSFVYAAAVRQLAGNTALAQEVAQNVFIQLARKAHTLRHHPTLTGWLFTSTRFAAANAARGESRRQARETKALGLPDSSAPDAPLDWVALRPFIDEALAELPEPDRVAVLQRYFEGRGFAEIGTHLSISGDAARLRIERALEKLRATLARRAVHSTASVIAVALTNEAAMAAPAGLAATISAAALAAPSGFAALLGTAGLVKLVAGALLVVGVGAGFWLQQRAHAQSEGQPATDTATVATPAPATPGPVASTSATTAPADPGIPPTGAAPSAGTAAVVRPASPQATVAATLPTPAERLAQVRRIVEREYGPILDRLQVTPDERQRLLQILFNLRETTVDFLVAAKGAGADPLSDREASEMSVAALRDGLYAQIRTILGDEKFATFLLGDEDMRRQSVVANVQKRLRRGPEPLTEEQQTKLLATLRDLQTRKVTDDVVAGAAEFLSPVQLDALKAIQDHRALGLEKPQTQKAVQAETAASAPAP
jgi:RNA polymerase sigma factor (sigma-70 family)